MTHVVVRAGTLLLALLVTPASAQRGEGPPTELAAPVIPGVIAPGTRIELVRAGFPRTEGPVGMPDGSILFTNTNTITRIDVRGDVSTYVERSNGANGLGFDSKGRLIAAERAPGNERVGVLHPSEATLAAAYDGKPFSRLNDLVVTSRDAVYFTDAAGVYYLPPGGGPVVKVVSGIPNPNGVQLSPDESVLYANDKDGAYLLAFDVRPDGTLINRRNFARYRSVKEPDSKDPLLAEDNGADGLAVDSDGRVYVATNVGVEVFDPTGQYLGAIPAVWGKDALALKKPQNVAFSGADKRTLYMVGSGAVFKVRTLAQGVRGRAK